MAIQKKLFLLLVATLFLLFPSFSKADVIVHDTIGTVGAPLFLKALTKGRFFPQGGMIVDFFIDEKKIGATLSGGDGYAYIKFTPEQKGLLNIKAVTLDKEAEGSLLIVEKDEVALVVEYEHAIRKGVLSDKPKPGSNEALKSLSNRYRIIYITTIFGESYVKKWLRNNQFPASPVLSYDGYETLEQLKSSELLLTAFIASPKVLLEASDYTNKRITFDESEELQEADDWDEVIELLDIKAEE